MSDIGREENAPPSTVWELIALTILLVGYLITIALVGDQGTFMVNLLGPGVMAAILLAAAIPAATRNPDVLWTPLFWFRIATVAYFSFGNIVTYFLNPASKRMVENFFSQYLDLLTKLNAVIVLCVLLTLASAQVTWQIRRGARKAKPIGPAFPAKSEQASRMLFVTALGFLAVGGFVKLVFVVPTVLGIGGFTLFGSVGALSLLADAGVYMLAVWAWRYRPAMVAVPIAITVFEVILGLLAFDKTETIASIMMICLAWLSKGVNFRRLAVSGLLVTVTFALIVPFVTSSRTELFRRYQSLGGAGIPERIEIAGFYFQTADQKETQEQSGLIRFSYVNGGTLAISMFDAGQPGNTLETLPAIFVPRAFWPDKPEMTAIGREFNYLATGSSESAASPGWFAETYWDFGWFGPFFLMIPLGVIYEFWSSFTLGVLRNNRWVFFPFSLLGMKTATSVDGFIVPDVLASAALAVMAYLVIWLAVEAEKRTRGAERPEHVFG